MKTHLRELNIQNGKYELNSNLGYKKFNDHKFYGRNKSANFYMAKYLDKEIDYDIFGL